MATSTTGYFTFKPSKGGTYYKAGKRLILRSGREVGTIAQDRTSEAFVLFLVSGDCPEFPSFEEAERYAWAHGV